uniref:Anaphase-promoting complex subunit CDC26 n=1 Tax=Ascaris lumbricoides TaxID=6252 RepID=A0A0M3I4X5_ASCLU
MLRRPPTVLDLKTEDIEGMEDAMLKLANKVKLEPVDMEACQEPEARTRIGAPPPRIRVTPARDARPMEQSNASGL